MKYLERYLGETYRNSCQTFITTETLETSPDTDIPTNIPDMDVESPNIYSDMTYLKKNNLDEAICQKLSKKNVYETNIHRI